jgi:uncharacterized RDD family membrane protein YckC
VRKIVLLTVAGLASAACSAWGVFAWIWIGGLKSHSATGSLMCILPALSLVAFALYFISPRSGLAAAWLLASGTYICLFLVNLQDCRQDGCNLTSVLQLAWDLLTRFRFLWVTLITPVCLLLDYTAEGQPGIASNSVNHDFGK